MKSSIRTKSQSSLATAGRRSRMNFDRRLVAPQGSPTTCVRYWHAYDVHADSRGISTPRSEVRVSDVGGLW
jgi:hypothetical protein